MPRGILGCLLTLGAGFGIYTSGCLATAVSRQQCQATLDTATTVANRLQSAYYSSTTGNYNQGSLWTDANAVEDLHNLMLAAGTTTWASVGNTSRIGRAAQNSNTNWQSILGGSNDDAQWIILALWKIADYRAAHSQSIDAFMSAAGTIYNFIAGQWDNTCGGGGRLFLLTSASGYLRTGNQTYLDNANKAWNWLSQSGMRNADGLWNDGLVLATCKNNGQTTWTYNQGVIASGLGALYAITGNVSLLDAAEITFATMAHLTDNGILKESCDDATSSSSLTTTMAREQQIFKGLWTKHVQYYLDQANDAARTAKYSAFLGAQSSGAFHYGKNANNDVGSVWYAPDQGGSIFSPEASSSGLEAFVSAAKVRRAR
ncbi:glycoside hydrolase family 76 protein [Heterobasidion irregulare TC 32-1]|uniref:Glycoside hydrolase family 76 protein n=1 Tax=Heterobasidion irregulare (strain TC 32-1) TaxID=747525 RepID=W4JZ44_HETIT|nr:glycoside hydrolase family 76 protein [Heterobasidion irregulare TC 32-1]ETW78838.1 glycoside hydrolase family 76 protein [Heterobasidion irregulare TC 32-1]